MEKTGKKISYLFIACFIVALLFVVYHLFFEPETVTPDRIALSLTPFTKSEQKELIRAQQMQERTADTGPLVALVNANDAQAKVLARK